jgi:hypothetical protein
MMNADQPSEAIPLLPFEEEKFHAKYKKFYSGKRQNSSQP